MNWPTGKSGTAEVAEQVAQLRAAHGLQPGLAVVLVGDDPASQIYVRSKGEHSLAAGMHSVTHRLPETTSQLELLRLVVITVLAAVISAVDLTYTAGATAAAIVAPLAATETSSSLFTAGETSAIKFTPSGASLRTASAASSVR